MLLGPAQLHPFYSFEIMTTPVFWICRRYNVLEQCCKDCW